MSGNNCLRILAIRQISNSMSNLKIQYESETLYEINKNHIFNTVFENHWKKSHSTLRAEASYGYILSGQKFFKNAKNSQFWRVLENLCGQTVLPDMSLLIGQKLVENAKIQNATFWGIFKQCVLVFYGFITLMWKVRVPKWCNKTFHSKPFWWSD